MSEIIPNVCDKHRASPVRIYGECIGCEIEQLTRDLDLYKGFCQQYLDERQEMRDLLPECLEEFGPDLLTALKNALKEKA